MAATTVYDYQEASLSTVRQKRVVDERLNVVSPQEALLQNAIGMGEELNTLAWSWQCLDFADPTAVNFEIIDADVASYESNHSEFLGNTVYEDFVGVKTGLAARKVSRYEGSGDTHAEQLARAQIKLIKRQELNLAFGEFTYGSTGAAAKTEGLFPWIFKSGRARHQATNYAVGSSTMTYTYGAYVNFIASGGVFTETVFYETLQQSHKLGNDISRNIAMMAPTLRKRFNDFNRIYSPSATETSQVQFFRGLDEEMAGITVELYKTEFGTIGLVSWRMLDVYGSSYTIPNINSSGTVAVGPADCIFGFDPSFVEVRPFMDYTYVPQPSGASEIGQIQCMFGLEMKNPRAAWGIVNIDGS